MSDTCLRGFVFSTPRSGQRRVLIAVFTVVGFMMLIVGPFALAGISQNPLWIALPVLVTLAYAAVKEWPRCLAYYRSLLPFVWVASLGYALAALAVTSGIMLLIEYLPHWSWLAWSLGSLFDVGGDAGMNSFTIPFTNPFFALVYAPAAAFALPLLAWVEEDIFRRGTSGLGSAIRRSAVFGFMHITAGVTVGACIALGFAGFMFTIVYWRALLRPRYELERSRLPGWAGDLVLPITSPRNSAEQFAVYRSTQVHLIYNIVGIAAILVLTLLP